jgi:hypothetical protein
MEIAGDMVELDVRPHAGTDIGGCDADEVGDELKTFVDVDDGRGVRRGPWFWACASKQATELAHGGLPRPSYDSQRVGRRHLQPGLRAQISTPDRLIRWLHKEALAWRLIRWAELSEEQPPRHR